MTYQKRANHILEEDGCADFLRNDRAPTGGTCTEFLDCPAAIEHLVKKLYWKIWALDPTGAASLI